MALTAINKYFKMYRIFFKYSIIRGTTYRVNFILELLIEIGYQSTILLFFSVLYSNIKQVGGWSYYEVLFLLGINVISQQFFISIIYFFNLRELPERIKDGEIDFTLLKPIHSLFNLTLATPYFAGLVILPLGFYLMAIAASHLQSHISLLSLFLGAILTISGLIIAYSIAVIIVSLAFKYLNAQRLPQIAENIIYTYTHNPHQVYQGVLKPIFYFILPIVFVSSIPASTVIRQIEWGKVILSLTIATIFLLITVRFWNIMIKNYTSASS